MPIFLVDYEEEYIDCIVYESITESTNRVEWQDVYEGKSTIIDAEAREYIWDSSRKDEVGCTYGYHLISVRRNLERRNMCLAEWKKNNYQKEFKIGGAEVYRR